MNSLMEKRKNRRTLAVCQVVDDWNNLIGFTLDLTAEGIRIIVPKNFTDEEEFSVILKGKETVQDSQVQVLIQLRWRQPKDEEFDEIGGLILKVDSLEKFADLLAYFHENAQIYDFDP